MTGTPKLIPPKWRVIRDQRTRELRIVKWETKTNPFVQKSKKSTKKAMIFIKKEGWEPPFPRPLILKK